MSEEENKEGQQNTVLLKRGDSTLRALRFYDAVVKQLKDLMAGGSGLSQLAKFSESLDLRSESQEELISLRNNLQIADAIYETILDLMEPKKYKDLTVRQFEEIITNTLTISHAAMTSRQAGRMAARRFREITLELRAMGVSNIDGLTVAAWYGVAEAMKEGLECGYRIIQLCMQDICKTFGKPRFPIGYEEYKSSFMQLHWQTKTGEESTPIEEKTMTQIFVYAAYNDISLDQEVEGTTLRRMIDLGSKALCFGYLMQNGRPEAGLQWRLYENRFNATLCMREPLFRTFYEEVAVYQKPKIIFSRIEGEYNYAFQGIDQSKWGVGELSGTIEEKPLDFEFLPKPKYAAISSVLGTPGAGKSTVLAALSTLLTTKGKGTDFILLSDNSNWAVYAFMPQMPVPGNSAFRFNSSIGIAPKAMPTLILNIVKDISEIQKRGEVLTKYDRIVRVKNTRSFRIEMDSVLDELGRIAEEFGYSGSTGLIAVRNLMRRGTDEKTGKRYDIEIQNAVSMLDSFNDWRRNHTKQPCGLTIDEIREAGLNVARSREQSQLADLIESAVISARRYNFAMKFAGHVTTDLSERARELTINTFWRNLPIERSEARSPLDILLDSLPLADPEQAEAVRRLYHSSAFEKTRLMFWHSKLTKQIEVVQPMPPPFQPHVVGKDPLEIYKFYLKTNPSINPDAFFRKSADLKYDFIASSADSGEEKNEEEEEYVAAPTDV